MLASTITYFVLRNQHMHVYILLCFVTPFHSEKERNMGAIAIASITLKMSSDFPCLLPFANNLEMGLKVSLK